MNYIKSLVFSIALFGCYACSEIKENEIEPGHSFTKIYNSEDFDKEFLPLDVKQTSDSGFLVLGVASTNLFPIDAATDPQNRNRPYLLKLDSDGEFVWEYIAEDPLINPMENLVSLDGSFHFFCMEDGSYQTKAFRVNEVTGTPEEIVSGTLASLIFPLAVTEVEENIMLLQGYNAEDNNTYLAKLNSDFSLSAFNEYGVGEETTDEIVNHIYKLTTPLLPFFTGKVEGAQIYYFNGFQDFNLSLNFVNATNLELTGGVTGFNSSETINSLTTITSSNMALTRKSGGQIYIQPNSNLVASANESVNNKGGFAFPELKNDARTVIKKITNTGEEFVLFGTETVNGQMLLLVYSTAGELVGTRYLGRGNTFEMGNFITTADEGLAVVGTVYAAGKFPRVALFKFSAEEFSEILGR